MKNLFISTIIALVVSASFVSTASAEPTPEKKDNVVAMTIKVTVKSNFSKNIKKERYHFSFEKPVTTLLKFCATENGSSRICLYRVEGNKETYVFDYNYSVIDDSTAVYETIETKPKTANR